MQPSIIFFGATGLIGSQFVQQGQPNVIGTSSKMEDKNNRLFKFDIRATDPDVFLDYLSHTNICSNPKTAVLGMMPFSADQCFYNRLDAYEANVIKTKNLINCLDRRGISVIFLSSDYVFDGVSGNYRESSEANPITEYGSQKFEVENHIETLKRQHLIFRLGKVVSTKPAHRSLLSALYQNFFSGKVCLAADDQFIGPVSLDDVVRCIYFSINECLKGKCHVSNGEKISRWQMVEDFATKLKNYQSDIRPMIKRVNLNDLDFAEKRPLDTSLDNDLIQKITHYEFETCDSIFEKFAKNVINS